MPRVTANAPASPIRMPGTTSFTPCLSTSPSTLREPAPNGMRTPISCVLRLTVYDTTP